VERIVVVAVAVNVDDKIANDWRQYVVRDVERNAGGREEGSSTKGPKVKVRERCKPTPNSVLLGKLLFTRSPLPSFC
jgi:hypothetical protein